MCREFTILKKTRMMLLLPRRREPGAGAHRVGAGMTCCLHQIAVDGPCLAITAFSHAVVEAFGSNSAPHQCKRAGYKSVLFLHVRGKKKGTKWSKWTTARTKSCGGKLYLPLPEMGVSITVIQSLVMYSYSCCCFLSEKFLSSKGNVAACLELF